MSFSPYPKMSNSCAWMVPQNLLNKIQFVGCEKVHGANMAFVVDRGGVSCARRRDIMHEDEKFFGYKRWLDPALWDAARGVLAGVSALVAGGAMEDALAAAAPEGAERETFGPVEQVTIYGELFGGHYPHPDVENTDGTAPVQHGVYYCPGLRYIAFDVAFRRPDDADGSTGVEFLDFEDAKALCTAAGFMFAQPLVRGSLEECVAAPLEYDSTIPARIGMPQLPSGTNLAEGYVVRPARLAHLTEAQRAAAVGEGGRRRLVFKRKNPRFEERVAISARAAKRGGKRRGGAAAGGGSSAGGAGAGEPTPAKLLSWELSALVNEQRLDSAVSKVGHPGKAPPGADTVAKNAWRAEVRRVVAEMVCDVLEDAELGEVATAFRARRGDGGSPERAPSPLLRAGNLELPRDPLAARPEEWGAVPTPERERAVKAMAGECTRIAFPLLAKGE